MVDNQPVQMGDVLTVIPRTDVLTDPVLVAIGHHWPARPAHEVTALSVFELAKELVTVLPDPDYDAAVRFNVAKALSAFLREAELDGPPARGADPQTIKVVLDKHPRDMGLRELLVLLIAEPARRDEVMPYLEADRQIRVVDRKCGGKWVITAEGGGVDLAATLEYVSNQTNPLSVPQRQFKGRRPVTLDHALGIDSRPLIHPFTGVPLVGPDANGFDFTELDPALHDALIWARSTGHEAWPTTIDVWEYCTQVFAASLNPRWQRILDDYLHAKEEGDEAALRASRFLPRGAPLDRAYAFVVGLVSGGSHAAGKDEGYYEAKVRAASVGPYENNSNTAAVDGDIYDSVSVDTNTVRFNGTILLGGGRINTNTATGTIYTPRGVRRPSINANTDTVKFVSCSWKDLAERAGLG